MLLWPAHTPDTAKAPLTWRNLRLLSSVTLPDSNDLVTPCHPNGGLQQALGCGGCAGSGRQSETPRSGVFRPLVRFSQGPKVEASRDDRLGPHGDCGGR
jgi:hypothetical protein